MMEMEKTDGWKAGFGLEAGELLHDEELVR